MNTIALVAPRKVARGTFVVLFWMAAALIVLIAHQMPVLKIAGVVGMAFLYIRLTARQATLDEALAVGVTWLLLDIVAELVMAKVVGHGWFELIGSPGEPWLRNLLMITWIIAPAVFARVRS